MSDTVCRAVTTIFRPFATEEPMTQLATLKEVAEKLQVSTRTVERLPIRFIRAGRQKRYDWADVERYLERHASRKKLTA